jgi:hypothetical protein
MNPSLYSNIDNFPPMMSDARNYTNWLPSETFNEEIKKNANIKSNWDYRIYLQQNASEIMKQNKNEAYHAGGVNMMEMPPLSNTPFMYKSTFDSSKPQVGYNNTDLKSIYLTSEQLNARMVAPVIPTANFK